MLLMQAMYNTVDSMYVSRISDGSLAAVTLAFPVQMIMGALSTGIGVGINSSISRNLGAKNYKEASAAAANGLMLGLFTVAIMAAFGLLGAGKFVSIYTDDPEVLEAGTAYLRLICLLGFGSIFSQLSFSVLQGSGSMLIPMISQISGGLVVIILDPILIFTAGMGIHGAAVASSTAQAVSMLIGMYGIFVVNKANLPVSFRGFRPDLTIIRDILAVGYSCRNDAGYYIDRCRNSQQADRRIRHCNCSCIRSVQQAQLVRHFACIRRDERNEPYTRILLRRGEQQTV